MLKPTGFWSYTTSDDTSSRGKLSQLRSLLAAELQQQVGRDPKVNIFQDVVAIPPGSEWDHQIRAAIEEASFIIPIVTPGFLQSEWCCREVGLFKEREDRLGVRSLVFPLHYVDTDHVDGTDPRQCQDADVLAFLRTRQWTDFRPLRSKSHESETVAVHLEHLASGILRALRDARIKQQSADEQRKRVDAETLRLADERRRRDEALADRLAQEQRQRHERARNEQTVRERAEAEAARHAELRRLEAETRAIAQVEQEKQKAGALAGRAADEQRREEALAERLAQEQRRKENATKQAQVARERTEAEALRYVEVRRVKAETRAAALTEKKKRRAAAVAAWRTAGLFKWLISNPSTVYATLGAIVLAVAVYIANRPAASSAPKVESRALTELERSEQAAATGNANAMFSLGSLYDYGNGVPQVYVKAREWYERAAAAGSADAMNNLGNLYFSGQGVPENSAKAQEWYQKGAAAGSVSAMNNLDRPLKVRATRQPRRRPDRL